METEIEIENENGFWEGFWEGYTVYLDKQKQNIQLDYVISQGIPKDRITMLVEPTMVGQSHIGQWLEKYTDIFISKRINELRSENLKKMLE